MTDRAFEDLESLSYDFEELTQKIKDAMNCRTSSDFSVRNLKKLNVDVLAKFLFDSCNLGGKLGEATALAKTWTGDCTADLIKSQKAQIELQNKLLETMSARFTQGIDTAIEKGMKSYSNVLATPVSNSEPNFTEEKLKKVVQEAVAEEDRSRNVMLFGLCEETEEDLNVKISQVFEEISEKPTFEAARIGRPEPGKNRPIKVSLRSSDAVHQILAKARQLRTSTSHRSVYIGPDRSPEERVKQKELLNEMKRKANEDTSKHYYIRSGRIFSRDKK